MLVKPKVSIVALCYNHSSFLLETLNSILQQDYAHLEVIVVDDCSTDDSAQKISEFINGNNLPWYFLMNEKNHGVSRTLNWAVQNTTGDYVKFISCDDVLIEGAINAMCDCFDVHSEEYGICFGDMQVINEAGVKITGSYLQESHFEPGVLNSSLFCELSKKCFIPAPATMIKRSVFKSIKFNEDLLFEDWDFWLQASKSFQFAFIDKPLVKYRRLQQSLFHSLSPEFRYSLMKMAYQNLYFDKTADFYFKKIIIDNAVINYIHRGKDFSLWLWRRFTYTKKLRDFYYYFKSLIIR